MEITITLAFMGIFIGAAILLVMAVDWFVAQRRG